MLTVPALGRYRQEDYKLKVDLDYKGRQKKREKEERRNKEEVREEEGRTKGRDEGNRQVITN